MTEYDPQLLAALGKRRKKAIAELNAVRPGIHEQLLAARRAGVVQARLVEMTGLTRDQIRKIWNAAGIEGKT